MQENGLKIWRIEKFEVKKLFDFKTPVNYKELLNLDRGTSPFKGWLCRSLYRQRYMLNNLTFCSKQKILNLFDQ